MFSRESNSAVFLVIQPICARAQELIPSPLHQQGIREKGRLLLLWGSTPSLCLSGTGWVTRWLRAFGEIVSAVKGPVVWDLQLGRARLCSFHSLESKGSAEQRFPAHSQPRPGQPPKELCWAVTPCSPSQAFTYWCRAKSPWFVTWVWT